MLIRYINGWQLHSYVEHGSTGVEGMAISARHLVGGHYFIQRFPLDPGQSPQEAADFIHARLFEVAGVTDDGTLLF